MSQKNSEDSPQQEPTGFTQHSGGLASEYAREQGWGLNEEERSKTPEEKQDYDGGTNYEYGARDFGDTAIDTSSAERPEGGERAGDEKNTASAGKNSAEKTRKTAG